VKLFLDTSVLLAACGSIAGASREIFHRIEFNDWRLISTPYVIEEVQQNLPKLTAHAPDEWTKFRPALLLMDDIIALDRPAVFEPSKDRPILFSALVWADVLLTLDQNDFGGLMNKAFYGLRILRPAAFLEEERVLGRLV
jgi:predicted nucleic acid-binding protein